MIDGRLLKDVALMNFSALFAVHLIEAWRFIAATTIKNCFVNCGFSVDRISSDDDSALKLTEGEKMTSVVCNLFECSLRPVPEMQWLSVVMSTALFQISQRSGRQFL
jgi:hypothetical protein